MLRAKRGYTPLKFRTYTRERTQMNSSRFDEFTKTLARPTSRRQVLKALGATVAGGIFGLRKVDHASASCKPLGHTCSKPSQCCSGYCSPQKICACQPPTVICGTLCCPAGQVCCNGNCINTTTNFNNCGK